jgi:UDP-glucose 4-epimerase
MEIVNKIRGAKVLVVGGAGGIGSHLVDALVDEGAVISVYDKFTRGNLANLEWARQNAELNIVEGDITDAEALKRACQGIDYVFHLAAVWMADCQRSPRLGMEINVGGTFNVLEAAQAGGVRKVIFSSAGAVYGEPVYAPVDEDHPLNPANMYAASKIAGEKFCEAFYQTYGLNYVALRYWNVYGPRVDTPGKGTQIIPRWLDLIEQGQAPVIHGDGRQTMDFVHVRDVARANVLACKSPVTNEVFNVGSGVETSARELAELLISLTETKLQPVHKMQTTSGHHVTRRWCSAKRASLLLNFRAEVCLCEGLQNLIRWRRKLNENLVLK